MQNSTATILANIAAQAGYHLSPSLILPDQTREEAATDFAWWSIGTAGDASTHGGDFFAHFNAWADIRHEEVNDAEQAMAERRAQNGG